MIFRIIGAVMIVAGCSGAGFLVAINAKRETAALKSLILVLEHWKNELSCHMTALPELCRQVSTIDYNTTGKFFATLAEELEKQSAPDAEKCIWTALRKFPELPTLIKHLIGNLGKGLGRFDLDGQLREIDSMLKDANRLYERHTANQEVRLRSYRILGICAGAAIVILFI